MKRYLFLLLPLVIGCGAYASDYFEEHTCTKKCVLEEYIVAGEENINNLGGYEANLVLDKKGDVFITKRLLNKVAGTKVKLCKECVLPESVFQSRYEQGESQARSAGGGYDTLHFWLMGIVGLLLGISGLLLLKFID